MDDDPNRLLAEDDPAQNFDFRRYVEALRKYAWVVLAIVVLGITASIIYTKRQPRYYEAEASVQIEPRLPDLLGQGQDQLQNPGVGATAEYYKLQRRVLGSYRLIRQTVEDHKLYTQLLNEQELAELKVPAQIELATARLRETLKVKYPDQDRVMYVNVRNTSPELAAEIANDHVATYEDYAKGLLSTDTHKASGALSAEFDDADAKLREAEAALYQFQKDNDLLAVTIEERQSMVSSSITAFTARLNEVRANRLELAAKLGRMRKASIDDVLTSPILSMANSTSFDSLRAQYYTERNKFIEMEQQIGPKNTQYQMQKAKLDDLAAALKTETKRMIDGYEEQLQASLTTEASLQAEIERATKAALELGPKIVAYNDLNRRKKSVEDRYNILRSRLSTSELTDRMNRNIDTNVRPLDVALVPTLPVSPNLPVNIVIGGTLSLMVGLGFILLIVFLDRSVKTANDAQQATSAAVIGIIPMIDESELPRHDDGARDLHVHQQPTSRAAECCRSLRTNLLFSAADRELKTLVVSSANPKEGKTTAAIYLGTTMAQGGQRVLLVDSDMRRPRLHASLGVSRQVGLSNLLVGDLDYDAVLKTTDIPNLFVLPCGPLPPNPAELLMSQRFKVVLAELAKRFDRVIFDSPPLEIVTDAVVLAKQTDGALLVVRADKTPRDDIRHSARQIRGVGGVILGVILNASEPEGRSYSYYGYAEKPGEQKS